LYRSVSDTRNEIIESFFSSITPPYFLILYYKYKKMSIPFFQKNLLGGGRENFPCVFGAGGYVEKEAGRDALDTRPALGQSPEFFHSVSCPGMESSVPTGASYSFPEKPANDKRYPNARKDVEEELLHKATSFTEDCPRGILPREPAKSQAGGCKKALRPAPRRGLWG
jgi:hypothetical protein